MVGDVSVGKLADLVMWKPANFGVRPDQIIKGGVIAWAAMGDANAVSYAAQFYHHGDERLLIVFVLSQSIPTVQPVIGKPMWGSFASVAALNSFSFVSKASIDSGKLTRSTFVWIVFAEFSHIGTIASYNLRKRVEAVRGCRSIGKKDMKLNDSMPKLTVDPETYRVEADGKHCTVEPATSLPLTQSHMLF
jgi:urease